MQTTHQQKKATAGDKINSGPVQKEQLSLQVVIMYFFCKGLKIKNGVAKKQCTKTL